ncbi:MAG: hypothetical protein IKZ88_03150 [Neisseriaceae bacterium]|nr:hypothetical protein [Neisseriaceae bacterium]
MRLVWWVRNPPYNKTLRFCGGIASPPYGITCSKLDFAGVFENKKKRALEKARIRISIVLALCI